MITVPESLKTEIEKLRGRHLVAKCQFDFSDTSIDNTITGFGGSINNAGSYAQLYNGKKDVSAKWFSLDGSCKLDGTYKLAPSTKTELERYEIGWWSEELSNANGDFVCEAPLALGEAGFGEQSFTTKECYPMVSVNFLARQVSQLSIAFDNAREEYAVDFDLNLYDITGTLLYNESITGNTGLQYTKDIAPVNGVCIVEYIIKKWSHPNRNAKVAEMFTMISVVIEGNDITNIKIVEDRELADDGIPLGTTSSGQCVVEFFNRDRLFDWDNTTSKLYNYVRKGVKIIPYLGDGINWVQLGVFFAEEWDIPKKNIIATVTGLDRMASLDDSTYATSEPISAPEDQTVSVTDQSGWAAGTMDGLYASDGTLRIIF